MKKIFSTILMAFSAALLLVPVAKAQTTPPYIVDPEGSGYAYNKSLTSTTPDANGEYTLRIETFATGSVKHELKTSDIIIVLDMSGSMRYDYYTGTTQVYPNAPETVSGSSTDLIKETGNYSGTYDGKSYTNVVRYAHNIAHNSVWRPTPDSYISNTCYNAEGGTARYYKYDGTYYLVHQELYNSHYFLYINTSSGKRYLWRGGSRESRPTGTTVSKPETASNDQTIFFGNLYRYKTRLEVLQGAVVQFMEAIKANSTTLQQQGKQPNRLAIVQFSGMSSPKNSIITTDPQTVTISGTTYVDHTFVRQDFTNVTSGNATTIENSIKALKCDGETPVHAGMRQARLLLDADNTNYNKYVVVFTDGEPRKKVGNSTDIETFYSIVEKAMTDANKIKGKSDIYTLALGPTGKNKTFLEHISSLYLPPVNVTNNGNTNVTYSKNTPDNPKRNDTNYYMDDATGADFTDLFNSIAADIISNGATSVVSIDLLTPSFKLPANVNPNRVKVYTAKCNGTSGGYLTFATRVQAPNRGNESVWVAIPKSDGTYSWSRKSLDIDNSITINVDPQNDKVTVGGFDYATLWCGPDEEHGGYHGYKLIFEFPIVVSDSATGGINVPTNLPTSGLYPLDDDGHVIDDPIIKYPIPHLDLPIKLIIQKAGLAKGESASFTIERRKMDGSDSWKVFTSFVLTGTGTTTNPEVRFLNLDASYYYRVKETGWSWSYESAPPTHTSTENLDPRLENPIIFTNTPKTTNVPKHAEAKSVNTMKTTGSATTTVLD